MIGIISYLPCDRSKRANRKKSLRKLIEKCREIFNLPILLIAQNYEDWEISIFKNYGCAVYDYEKSGILQARSTLQQKFLESNYDNLIMLDDDCVIEGSKKEGKNYLDLLDNHPSSYGLFSNNFLKLFSISKDLYDKFTWPVELRVEDGDIFEDIYLTMWLNKHYSNRKFRYKVGLKELSNSQNDRDSTWLNEVTDKDKMFENTINLIRNN